MIEGVPVPSTFGIRVFSGRPGQGALAPLKALAQRRTSGPDLTVRVFLERQALPGPDRL